MSVIGAFRAFREVSPRRAPRPAFWLWNMDVSGRWGAPSDYPVSSAAGRVGGGDRWPALGILAALLAEGGDVLFVERDGGAGYDQDLMEYWRVVGLDPAAVEEIEIDRAPAHTSFAAGVGASPAARRRAAGGGTLICFGNGPDEDALAATLGLALFGGSAVSAAACNSKAVVKQWCLDLGLPTPEGAICRSATEVECVAADLLTRFERIAVKEPFSASGKGIVLMNSAQRAARLLGRAGATANAMLVVEGWYDKCISHNTQIMILPGGEALHLGHTEQLLDLQKYRGNRVPRGFQRPASEEQLRMQLAVARRAYEAGYTGLLGIDSFITADGRIIPVVELNARLNLSTYALAAIERLAYSHEACVKSYVLRRRQPSSLAALLDRLGADAYCRGAETGALPLAFTGATTPRTEGVMRVVLLYLGEDAERIEALRARCEAALEEPQ